MTNRGLDDSKILYCLADKTGFDSNKQQQGQLVTLAEEQISMCNINATAAACRTEITVPSFWTDKVFQTT